MKHLSNLTKILPGHDLNLCPGRIYFVVRCPFVELCCLVPHQMNLSKFARTGNKFAVQGYLFCIEDPTTVGTMVKFSWVHTILVETFACIF